MSIASLIAKEPWLLQRWADAIHLPHGRAAYDAITEAERILEGADEDCITAWKITQFQHLMKNEGFYMSPADRVRVGKLLGKGDDTELGRLLKDSPARHSAELKHVLSAHCRPPKQEQLS